MAMIPVIAPDALAALQAVDFDWVTRIDSIWSNPVADAPDLHDELRRTLSSQLDTLISIPQGGPSSLGTVLLGGPGQGKTHLLSVLRREAIDRGAYFVLVDMTDVRDFWPTAALGFLDSLSRPGKGHRTQLQLVLQGLAGRGIPGIPAEDLVDRLAASECAAIKGKVDEILAGIGNQSRDLLVKAKIHHHAIRALFLLNASDFGVASAAHAYLQGVPLDMEDGIRAGLLSRHPLKLIVEGVSWAMSMSGPSVVAFDQLDSIVAQYNLAAGRDGNVEPTEEQKQALAIIEGLAGGLSAIVDCTRWSLPVVTALPDTWEKLRKRTISTSQDRFRAALILGQLRGSGTAMQILERRLAQGYGRYGYRPKYPTWPFPDAFFEAAVGQTPREVLQKAYRHQQFCAGLDAVEEWRTDETANQLPIGHHRYEEDTQAEPDSVDRELLDPANEDKLGAFLLAACELLDRETPPLSDVDVVLDHDFAGKKTFPALHARLRRVFRAEGDREEHYSLRVLQHSHHAAYKARLNAAMTAAGIDRGLSFRQLAVVRTVPLPTTSKLAEITKNCRDKGGRFVSVNVEELARMRVLLDLSAKKQPDFDAWLRQDKPLSKMQFFQDAFPSLFAATETVPAKTMGARRQVELGTATPEESLPTSVPSLLIGRRILGGKPGEPVLIAPTSLSRHVVIRAGSGGGKTVLLKRLVEEAAIAGIPSILVDPGNDLAQLGDEWPVNPEHWMDGDPARSANYHVRAEVVIWTPGRSAGRPLQLAPLPDLAAVSDDEDQLNSAVQMGVSALEEHVAAGNGAASKKKRGVLSAALRNFARSGAGGLPELISFLSDLPHEAGAGIGEAVKLAAQMADDLRVAMQINPLLAPSGSILDPAELFGLKSGKTRVSVISLVGLPALKQQQEFVNQLAMTLFAWIKQNPSVGAHGMTGLFVIDEARDFLPSVATTPCKNSLLILAAQARKYGLGMVLATQNPKDLDYKAVAQFSTQFFGRANSPQVIEFIRGLIQEKGGNAEDLSRLQKGQFYLCSDAYQSPVRIHAPMCLSHHPDGKPLTEGEILERASR
ncbi:MAG: hypothetical protein SFV51_00875 [Bryobacteraceae bacterium]|nr:hypothetical protein [Bryobacteraceae bacterium]